MSTSIYKPLGLSLSTRTSERMLICRPEVRRVKRILFEPVDHVATQNFIDEELEKFNVVQSEKWNFDFKREQTLYPNGRYQWRPATPQKNIRPIKVRPSPEEDIEELYGEPIEIIRPIPVRAVEEKEDASSKTNKHTDNKPQRLITDFMTVKKRSTSDFLKKSEWSSSMERPKKLPRLADFTS